MGRTVTKSIAIIGEGETEWFYILSRLRLIFRSIVTSIIF